MTDRRLEGDVTTRRLEGDVTVRTLEGIAITEDPDAKFNPKMLLTGVGA